MTGPVLTPILSRQTMAQTVYARLRAELMEGVFEAGSSFPILDIADRFGTSNTPVREALRRLTDEGALVEGKWGSATLPPLGRTSYSRLCQARAVIEGGTAALATPAITAAAIDLLHDISAQHQQALMAGRMADMLAGNKAFHFTLYAAAGNPTLIEQIESLWLRTGPYTRFLAGRMQDALIAQDGLRYARHHDDLLVALERRDGAGARDAIMADVMAIHDWTCRFLPE